MKKIYCAGPLFNNKEREEMSEIAHSLENSGYSVFLPHRDGLEFAKISKELVEQGMKEEIVSNVISKSIFFIDTFQVADSDGLILNINGRVPDEGAMVEAGIAWSLGKPIVIYKNDSRSLLSGKDNPLILGLSSFKVVYTLQEIISEFDKTYSNGYIRKSINYHDPELFSFKKGRQLYNIFSKRRINRKNIEKFMNLI